MQLTFGINLNSSVQDFHLDSMKMLFRRIVRAMSLMALTNSYFWNNMPGHALFDLLSDN